MAAPARGSGEEVEFKAGVDAGTLEALRARVAGDVGELKAQRLLSVYYDAPDLRLAAKGLFLRLRRQNGHWEQTVKAGRRARLGLQRVTEDTVALPGPQPSPERIVDGALRDLLLRALGSASLEECCRSEIQRRSCLLADPRGTVELALDAGRMVAAGRSEPVCEVEIECVSGSDQLAYARARDLLGGHAAQLLQPSKAQRGFALARGAALPPPSPQRSAPQAMAGDASAGQLFAAQLAQLARAVACNLYCVLRSGDLEGPHQLRVALRRLRVLLRGFAPGLRRRPLRGLERRARDLGRLASPLRDADALIEDLLRPRLTGEADAAALIGALEKQREDIRARGREDLLAAAATGFAIELLALADLGSWRPQGRRRRALLECPPVMALAPALEARWQRAKKRGRNLASLSPSQRHRLRKDLKQLRYLAELAAAPGNLPGAERFLKRLAKLQRDLGFLNDLAVLEALQLPTEDARALAALERVSDAFAGGGGGSRDRALRRAARHWRKLAAQGRFW